MMKSSQATPLSEKIEALGCASIYPSFDGTPEVIQTHISVVFLTDREVYKLKKPVDLGFLDFSSLRRRKEACQAEVAVNRRLAPDVYDGVVALVRDDEEQWSLHGPVDDEADPPRHVVDWLVKMRRLPEERCLKHRLHRVPVTDHQVREICQTLTDFYHSLPAISHSTYAEDFREHIDANASTLLEARLAESPDGDVATMIRRLTTLQRCFLFAAADLLAARVAAGHVVEGHGDLRADHIYLTDPPVAIDGIEFDRQLRLVDIADELCFLSVTCEFEGAAEVGQRILAGVCAQRRDTPPDSLLDFYRAYRATVRAKVAALRCDQTQGEVRADAGEKSLRYLRIADAYARRLGAPPAVIVRGLSGSGKTTLAGPLGEALAAEHLATDQLRRRETTPESDNRYSDAARDRIYGLLVERATRCLDRGSAVVLDGTFLKQRWLDEAVVRLREHGAEVLIVTCQCPQPVAIDRIEKRNADGESASEADATVRQNQTDQVKQWPADAKTVEVDTTRSVEEQMERVRDAMGRSKPQRGNPMSAQGNALGCPPPGPRQAPTGRP
ncbi:bifunctional aminoglycoside phosphotransferase/ATP-binding protein [Roseimaritima sediminicola]|uniref:bifunctional aminoglycoside phosphotransferase/ATP-binding protein n=1 Tax=Roseimaritima sediminicola TaxID=2662066 RepID=UPI00129824D4|nr:AAA family ATPase [Roseimaritima sediminicola]